MKYSDQSEKSRPMRRWVPLVAAGFMAALIAGCGGGGTGANTTAVKAPSNSVAASAASSAAWKALAPQITITSASIGAAADARPIVKFTVKDTDGNPIVGLGNKSKSSTSVTVAGLVNVNFTLAKLVPGTNNQPSKWVSYLVTTVPTTTTGVVGTFPTTDKEGDLVDYGDGTYQYTYYRNIKNAETVRTGLTDDAAKFKYKADLGDLTYDPTLTHRVGIQIGGAAPGTGTNLVDPVTLLPASGAPVSVSMVNAGNAWFDFRPDGGSLSTTRQIVKIESCSDCHAGKVFAHGSRKDPNYCVTCHTDQIKYSFNITTSSNTDGAVMASDGVTFAVQTGTNDVVRPAQAIVNGRAVGNFPNMVHKIHMGSHLTKKGYNYNNHAEGLFNEFKYPQDQRNCIKCHDGSATAVNKTANGDNWKNVPSPLACGSCHDGIKFDSSTGTRANGQSGGHGGATLAASLGYSAADPTRCVSCHDAASIAFVHTPVTKPDPANSLLDQTSTGLTPNGNTNAAWIASNTANRPVGAIKVTYDVKTVSRVAIVNTSVTPNVTNYRPQMVFRMLQDGARADFNTFVKASTVAGDTATPEEKAAQELWTNFMGAPSVYFVFAVPQDGIQAPADFNASASAYLRDLWNGNGSKGTLTGPDANGYYTATLTTVTIPDNAVMLTGGLGYSYSLTGTMPLTQTNLTSYPVAAATATTGLTAGMPNKTGGLIVVAPDAQKVGSTGAGAGATTGAYSGRRAIVEDARCNKCHQELGIFTAESFHGGQRNDGSTCSWCHTPNRASSGWGADSTNFIHSIHAGGKRTDKFTWHAGSTTEGLWSIGYPGVLQKCETCHLPGTYDFAASASASAMPNKQYRTVATGKFNRSSSVTTQGCTTPTVANNQCFPTALSVFSLSPDIMKDTVLDYGSGFSVTASTGVATQAAGTTLVDSPITTVCFACHDSTTARAHMKGEGGSIYVPRSTALNADGTPQNPERCMTCHATGRVADIRVMHSK